MLYMLVYMVQLICSFLLQSGAHFSRVFRESQKSIPETFMVLTSVGLCQKEENNWVQIVNSKTGRTPQFNELGLKLPDFQ